MATQADTGAQRARLQRRACAAREADPRAQRARPRGLTCAYPQTDTRAQRARRRGHACAAPQADTKHSEPDPEGAPVQFLRQKRAQARPTPTVRPRGPSGGLTYSASPTLRARVCGLSGDTRAQRVQTRGRPCAANQTNTRAQLARTSTARLRGHSAGHARTAKPDSEGASAGLLRRKRALSERDPESAPAWPLRRTHAHRDPDN